MSTTPKDWGQEAIDLLFAIENPHARIKRRTLLALADVVLEGKPFSDVWSRVDCSSDNAHYKWRKFDPAYEAAYQHLVGEEGAPGLARQLYNDITDAMEADAATAVARARQKIKINSEDAVDALVRGLTAVKPVLVETDERKENGQPYKILVDMPDTANQIAAARELLNRLPETAPASKQDITTGGEKLPATLAIAGFNSILAKIYGEDGDDTDDDDSTDETADSE